MKKVFLSATIVGTMMLAACKNSTITNTRDENIADKIENCTNGDSIRMFASQAKAHAKKLMNEGKVKEAKEYLARVEKAIKNNTVSASHKISTDIKNAEEDVKTVSKTTDNRISTETKVKLEQGKEVVKNTYEKTKDKSTEVYDKAKEKVENTAEKVKDKIHGKTE